jgi:hypothetical protein
MLRTFACSLLAATLIAGPALAEDPVAKTVAEVHQEKAALAGKQIVLHGKVVKANNGIMERNWIHLRDGTGDAKDGTNDITVTSAETAELGDEITATGTLAVDQDFGYGYKYPLIVEKATIAKTK